MHDAGLPVACVLKMYTVMAAIRVNVPITTGVKTKSVHRKKELHIALNVKKIVKRGYCIK